MRHRIQSARRRRSAKGGTNRRGATLVLFSLLIVPLLGLAAFAIDASQWQVGGNELQTAADAAALAGARGAQLNPLTAQATATAYATTAASANKAFGVTVTITGADVEPARFNPSTSLVTLTGTWSDYNAVQVTTRGTGRQTLSAVMMSAAPQVTRTAVAWIANVNGGSCIKPWALPYTVLYDSVVAATGYTSNVAPTPPSTNPPFRNNLSQQQINRMEYLTENGLNVAQRTIILRGPNTETVNFPTGASPGSLPTDNQWYGYNFDGNAGTSYQGQVGNCSLSGTVGVNAGTTLPGGGTDYECWTINAMIGGNANNCNNSNYLTAYTCNGGGTNGCPTYRTCVFRETSNAANQIADARCYDPALYAPTCNGQGNNCNVTIPVAASPGVYSTVVWGDAASHGSNLTAYRQIGQFKLVCVFRQYSQGSSGVPRTAVMSNVIGETCAVPGGTTYSNLPHGTMVGVIEAIGMPKLGNGVTLGNEAALGQRLVLVH